MVTILLTNENIFQGFFVSNHWSIIPLQMFGLMKESGDIHMNRRSEQ